MKISENKIRDIIMEELANLTSMPLVAYASKELSNKLLNSFKREDLNNLSKFEIERMLDELITSQFLEGLGLSHRHSEDILLGALEKIRD